MYLCVLLLIHSVLCVIPNWTHKYVENDTMFLKLFNSQFEHLRLHKLKNPLKRNAILNVCSADQL